LVKHFILVLCRLPGHSVMFETFLNDRLIEEEFLQSSDQDIHWDEDEAHNTSRVGQSLHNCHWVASNCGCFFIGHEDQSHERVGVSLGQVLVGVVVARCDIIIFSDSDWVGDPGLTSGWMGELCLD
jgi:hypothetical protein